MTSFCAYIPPLVSLLLMAAIITEVKTERSEAVAGTALVLYDEDSILPHHKPEKSFTFGDHVIIIKQNWAKDGVAGVVWDAAIVLCEYMMSLKATLTNKKLLEIGAGTGLAGICSYHFGANVVLTDRQETIQILQDNVQLNAGDGFTQTCERKDNRGKVDCDGLGQGHSSPDVSDVKDRSIITKVLDWSDRTNSLYDEQWDYVIGADIIYIESSFNDLLSTMRQLTTNNLILSCRLRYGKDHRFIKRAQQYFIVDLVLYDKPRDIYVYSFKHLEDK